MNKLFDTSDPENNLGPFLVAVIIALAIAVVLGGLGLARHGGL